MAKNDLQVQEATQTRLDDFKRIRGIKQGIENRLHTAGVETYSQLASLTPEEILAKLGKVIGYTAQRIAEEDWSGQASELADLPLEEEEGIVHQHYATFTLELLLGEENEVRRTRMVHIQSESEEAWAGWDEARLVGFIRQRAQLPADKADKLEAIQLPVGNEDLSADTNERELHTEKELPVTGTAHLQEVEIISPVTGDRRRMVAPGQPFGITMTLDFAEVRAHQKQELCYRVVAFAKELRSGSRQTISMEEGNLTPGDVTTIQLKSDGLPEGMYRIALNLEVHTSSTQEERAYLEEMLEGGLLQVY